MKTFTYTDKQCAMMSSIINEMIQEYDYDYSAISQLETIRDILEAPIEGIKAGLPEDLLYNFTMFLGNATFAHYVWIFGPSMGQHLWLKFYSGGKYDYRRLLRDIDQGNLRTLQKHLQEHDYFKGAVPPESAQEEAQERLSKLFN